MRSLEQLAHGSSCLAASRGGTLFSMCSTTRSRARRPQLWCHESVFDGMDALPPPHEVSHRAPHHSHPLRARFSTHSRS